MNDLVEKPKTDTSARFRVMAERIEHNNNAKFGGAVVIMPPEGGGDPIELLILDESADVAQFWATIKTRIEFKIAELDQKIRNQNSFSRR